jgi:hypothetical protein
MRCLDGEERRGNKEVEEEGKWVSENGEEKKLPDRERTEAEGAGQGNWHSLR